MKNKNIYRYAHNKIPLHFPYIVFLLIVMILLIINFKPGTYLSGWDNLQTEFAPLLAIERSFFAVWQEYQGLGLLAGMGHASDLIRQIFLYLFSLILPDEYIRYFFHFLLLLTGSIGLYRFLYSAILNKIPEKIKMIASFSGGILYLFNLATVQMFYVPYEPFSVQFALLPWLFWANHQFIEKSSRKYLFYLILINFLAVPQGYVGTLFLVYCMAIGILYMTKLIENYKNFKNILIALILTLFINSFWLLPNLYFVYTKSSVNLMSKSNQMVTADNFLRNKKFGDLSSVMLFKGFWFDNVEINEKGNLDYQLGEWVSYLQKDLIVFLGNFIFITGLLGLILAVYYKNKKLYPVLLIFMLSLSVIGNDIPYISNIAGMFFKLPLFSQLFRTPFTKFAFILTFSLSVFYGYLLSRILINLKNKLLFLCTTLLFIIIPLIVTFPVFSGNLFYSRVKADIPHEYFEVFKFFRSQDPHTRIANFPQYSYWGWTFYRWNYSGSGFLWYGIEQPVIDRAFDVWSREKENYYHEITYALYSGNMELFEKILEKYQIKWLLVDFNAVSFSNAKELYWDRLIKIISTSQKIKLTKKFGNIGIYSIDLAANPEKFIFLAENIVKAEPIYNWNNYDSAFDNLGIYANYSNKPGITGEVYFPFRSLFTGRKQDELEFTISQNNQEYNFSSILPRKLKNNIISIPELKYEEIVEVMRDNSVSIGKNLPSIFIDGKQIQFNPSTESGSFVKLPDFNEGLLELKIPLSSGLYSYNSDIGNSLLNKKTINCNVFNSGIYNSEIVEKYGIRWLRLFSQNSNNCFEINLSRLSHKFSYIIKIESFNQEGKSLLFNVRNKISKRSDIEVYLPESQIPVSSYYILPPMEEYGAGYVLHFDNISIGREKSVNFISSVTVNPVPYNFLTSLNINGNTVFTENLGNNVISELTVKHPNTSLYKINLSKNQKLNNETTLVLSQSFDPGWKAYIISRDNIWTSVFPFWFGRELKNHLLINNWENGWSLDNDTDHQINYSNIIIVYLPQYLQYLGFAMWLFIPLLFFLAPKKINSIQKSE